MFFFYIFLLINQTRFTSKVTKFTLFLICVWNKVKLVPLVWEDRNIIISDEEKMNGPVK